MKETTLEAFAQDPAAFLEAAQKGRVLVTDNGKPLAVIVGIQHKDQEDFALESSAEFWKMIEDRRREPTIPLAELEARQITDEATGR